jgi:hypothetical protein
MVNTRPGFLTRSGIVAGFLTIIGVVVMGLLRGGSLFIPGPLNAKAGAMLGGVTSHAELITKCSACHTAIWQTASMADRCVACHTDVTEQQKNPVSLHGILYKTSPEMSCRNCHPDHLSLAAPLTDMQNMKFPHDWAGYSITAHQKRSDGSPFSCNDCHRGNFIKFDKKICLDCHQQIKPDFTQSHIQAFGENCLVCHDGKDTYGHAFNHKDLPFQLNGAHAQVPCEKCHQNAQTLAVLRATPSDCVSCHTNANPHSEQLGTDCAVCHKPAGWTPATFDHNLAAYKLEGKHAGVPCENCHINKVFKGTPTDCVSCHKKDDKHNAQYGPDCALCHKVTGWLPSTFNHALFTFKLTGKHTTVPCLNCHVNSVFKGTPSNCGSCHAKGNPHSPRLGTECGACHLSDGWLPAAFDHNLAAFKLTGKHVQAACTDCHKNKVYQGTNATCSGCHQKNDKHNGQFGNDCGSCHKTSAWLPATFDHNNRSAFKLTGAHIQAACASCHINNVYKGTASNCNSCHAQNDHHKGQLGTNCGACHSTSAWLPSTFNHNSSTAFNLTGAHIQAACSACHANNVFKGTPTNCYACHKNNDHHNGQFGTDCGACHATSAWLPSTFDHNQASFKLTGKHIQLACNACHVNNVFNGTPSSCYACHQINDHHNGQFGTNCGTCHKTSGWLPASFDHNSQTSFKLTGAHVQAACAGCHANNVYKGTPTNCYACHAQNDHHNGAYGNNCGTCHTTNAWLPANYSHSGFPLKNGHAGLSCNSCHSSGKYAGLSKACSSCHSAPASHAGYSSTCTQCHTTSNWNANFNHPSSCGGSCINHHRATCSDCHTKNYSSATCTKCHDSNKPGD